jgi:tetratricopeptide (TPR) repeat protein
LNDPTTESRGIVIADSAVNEQVLRVLDLIEKDEREYSAEPVVIRRRGFKSRWLAVAAMLTVTVGIGSWSIVNLIRGGGSVSAPQAIVYLKDAQRLGGVSDLRPSDFEYEDKGNQRGSESAKDIRDAKIDLAQRAMKEIDPKSASVEENFAYAKVLLFSEKRDEAAEVLTSLLDSGTLSDEARARAQNDLGVVHFESTNYDLARDSFERALALKPDMEEARFNRAVTAHEIAKAAAIDENPQKAALAETARNLLKDFIDSMPEDQESQYEASRRLEMLQRSR